MYTKNEIKKTGIKIHAVIIGMVLLFISDTGMLNAQFVPTGNQAVETALPNYLIRKFKRDASRLALRLEGQKASYQQLNISIPKNTSEIIFDILSRIYLTDTIAKTIIRCNVQTFPDPPIESFTLIFNKNVVWSEPLQNGINETSDPVINTLMDTYQLVIEQFIPWNNEQNAITMRSREPLNMIALAEKFRDIDGVAGIDLGIPKISGNDIQIRRINSGWEITYVLVLDSSFGIAPKTHIWKYKVLDSGTIRFISETGDPIPEWMRCFGILYPESNIF